MNIDKILKFFVPKDHSFHPLFEEDAKNMVRAAELFKQMLSSTDSEYHEKIHKEIKNVEHIGDEITDKMYQQLNKSFITPFDREDIHELTAHIDDVVDSINGVSRRICLYKPKHLLPVYKQMADMIHEAAIRNSDRHSLSLVMQQPIRKRLPEPALRSPLSSIRLMNTIMLRWQSFSTKKKMQRNYLRITRSLKFLKDVLMKKKMLLIQ